VNPFELSLRLPFVADHFHDLPGFVEARHGHNWEVEATVRAGGPSAEPSLRRALEAWVKGTDYCLLNDQAPLTARNPTAELLAQWAFESLREAGLDPVQVKIREKANYWASCEAGVA
jgi:6-pyruvoyl-tetrahydropterin synthase